MRDRVVSVRAVAAPAHATKLSERGIDGKSWTTRLSGVPLMPRDGLQVLGAVSAAQDLATKGCSPSRALSFAAEIIAAVRTPWQLCTSKEHHTSENLPKLSRSAAAASYSGEQHILTESISQ